MSVEFRILGPVQVMHAGSELPLGGPRHRKLLAVLLLHADEVVPVGRLVDALWGESPPRSARDMLHVRVSELRAALRAGRPDGSDRAAGLLARDGGYLLQLADDGLDARTFERLAAAGARALGVGDHDRAQASLTDALSLWHGPALAEFADEPFATAAVTRLEGLRVQARENRLTAELALGRHADLVAELETLTASYPLRERFWFQLMLALYRAGRQSEALATYRAARDVLTGQLGVEPGTDLRKLHAAVLRQDPALGPTAEESVGRGAEPAAAPPPRRVGNVPAGLTGFVGRQRDLAEVGRRLRAGRLVTLTGVGGAGKSRLAVEAVTAVRADFPDGTWLVDLAAVTQPGLVVSAVAATLGVREHPRRPLTDVIADHLATATALVILDNCEHLVAEVAEVADRLLRACPALRIVTTSRERLNVTGEQVWPVGGLTVPAPGAAGSAAVAGADAVRLIVERVAAASPAFALTDANSGAIAQICRRLDGLPLALELAAASIQALGANRVARRLDDRFRLLVRGSRTALPRHQTLQAIVDWSYELLDAAHRRLFDRLAVFVGGFTLTAAEAVCADGAEPEPMVELLAGLVDKSLVLIEKPDAATPRYRMLETLRAYGWQRLADTGRADEMRDRHAVYVLTMVRSARAAWQSTQQPVWLRRLAAEHGNIRAALQWLVERGDAATAVRLAGYLYPLWDRHGHYREGRRWLTRALAMDARDSPVPPVVRARALDSLAGLAVLQGDLTAAAAAAGESAELSRSAGDDVGVAGALTTSGLVAIYAGDHGRAAGVLEEALCHARAAGAARSEGFALMYLGIVALADDHRARAAGLVEECTPVLRSMGDPEALAGLSVLRGIVALRTGDTATAGEALGTALHGYRSLGHVWGLSLALHLAAELAAGRGEQARAVSLLGTSAALRDSVGAAVMPFNQVWIDAGLALARTVLTPAAVDAAWRAGYAAPPGTVVDEALRAPGVAHE
jgi:predicted ATPase/DNA-binding SARP family transcriptional activator